jgi:hypothetical protein
MFDVPKSILRKMLNVYHSHPEQLSTHEQAICERIVICSLCDNVWVRRAKKVPDRCPACHRRAWDRPLLEALMAREPTKKELTTDEARQPKV